MSKRTDSNSYTMIFAVVMVFVVGSLLAFLASSLKPTIKEKRKDRNPAKYFICDGCE